MRQRMQDVATFDTSWQNNEHKILTDLSLAYILTITGEKLHKVDVVFEISMQVCFQYWECRHFCSVECDTLSQCRPENTIWRDAVCLLISPQLQLNFIQHIMSTFCTWWWRNCDSVCWTNDAITLRIDWLLGVLPLAGRLTHCSSSTLVRQSVLSTGVRVKNGKSYES